VSFPPPAPLPETAEGKGAGNQKPGKKSGNGLPFPLRWPPIHATLRTLAGLSKIRQASDAVALLRAARHFHHTMSIWIGRILQ
jgi:hypothetical protein